MQHFFEGGSLFIEEMSPEQRTTANELSEIIAENFGANATYVETLLARWRSDPSLVDESWRAYFTELLGDVAISETSPAGHAATQPQADGGGALPAPSDGKKTASAAARAAKKSAPEVKPTTAPVAKESTVEAVPIRGAALKIVENMEASLAVPTA